ncbi:vacuolar protein sorting-associated protein 33a [Anaeramoeba flamelloides]|uniref:Vacuolar protein sorting-associated protein 33a n=1 Tax=Anaeramoeba flamelloides TaxID=1746091 RepID=A0ABQ8X9V9_9EUKA|nr:vacuolar protein sorting-associated protein 33a [Anaeramoeba flamelloides]
MSLQINLDNLSSVPNLKLFRDFQTKELLNILSSINAPKGLVLDPALANPLTLIVDVRTLKKYAVDQLFLLSSKPFDTSLTHIVYLVRPTMSNMKKIARHIHHSEKINSSVTETRRSNREEQGNETNQKRQITNYVFLVPRITTLCRKLLEYSGVLGSVILDEYHLDLIPYDEDVLSLAYSKSFREFLKGDTSSLFYISRALHKLQSFVGQAPRLRYYGTRSKSIVEILRRLRRQDRREESSQQQSENNSSSSVIRPQIAEILLIDRHYDLISPLVHQLSYEGMLDELYGITDTVLELDPKILNKPRTGKKERISLNSNDLLFAEIRDLNQSQIGPYLSRKAREIMGGYDERKNLKTIREFRNFTGKLGKLQKEHSSLSIHLSIAEAINKYATEDQLFHRLINSQLTVLTECEPCYDFLEELIYQEAPIETVLRLLCLHSLALNGIKSKKFDFFRKEIIQTYGFQHVITLNNLEKLGMIKKSEGRSKKSYTNWKKQLNLIDHEFTKNNGIHSVHSGYAPISIKLIQALYENSKKDYNEFIQTYFQDSYGLYTQSSKNLNEDLQESEQQNRNEKDIVLVFFIGGVTYSEISALRLLNQSETLNVRFIVGTTDITNGDKIIKACTKKTSEK